MKTETLDISLPKPYADSLILQVNELHYDPEVGQIFANWYVEWSLETAEDESLEGFFHPPTISNLTFHDNVLILSEFFAERPSEPQKYFDCLSLAEDHDEDWMTILVALMLFLSFAICLPFRRIISSVYCFRLVLEHPVNPMCLIEESDNVTLETCDGGLNRHKSEEKSLVNRISCEGSSTLHNCVSTLCKTLTEYWLCNDL
ncbi:unnamed protein product [Hymenolepis diminuta]|uniref:Uncharacterized protein n=1 Tax=Hymenolepis diminuta TaxID=6216 RepID=A0A564YCM4_HYMDI|nr:unnamed protein product [Hymenolepis diminuta]VUZ44958.1 unnamed protein product [Hymenolepis diminuta]